MDVYINGKKVRADPKQAIGKGGEADVFQLDPTTALKLFKPPNHPDYQGLPHEQQAASDRIQLHQQKLTHFPKNLPPRVIAPTALATDKSGKTILGYTMPLLQNMDALLRYSERSFRQRGISAQTVVQVFQNLHDTVSKLHVHGVVIGDFNDLNVLVQDTAAYLIDADSFQFGSFPCQVFTARFVDPLLCDPNAHQPILQQSPTANSDWYAFAVMLMQCLLFVDPYGGVYKPKDPTQNVVQGARSLHRITVFHPEVRYPKPAIPYQVLPDELLHYFQQVFERDQRGEFPRSMLDNLHWTQCSTCGREYARDRCPHCLPTTMGTAKTATMTARGTVTATQVFQTQGIILHATVTHGQLQWVYHDRGQFYRENGSTLLHGSLNPHLHWQIQGETTQLGYQGQIITFYPDRTIERIAVKSLNTTTLFATNAVASYWIAQGQLLRQYGSSRSAGYTPDYIGDVLPNQTRFWVGSRFGLGFYQAGNLKVAFVFDVQRPGLNDRVQLPPWPGQLIHATCTFSDDYGWLWLTTQAHGQIHYTCVVLRPDGSLAALAQTTDGSNHWLTAIGKNIEAPGCAIANFLLAATDDGIIRIELQNGQLVHTKTFPDTAPFVDRNCQLLPAPQGLYVIKAQEIVQLAIA